MTDNGIFFGTGGGSVGTESEAVLRTKHWVERERRDDIVGELRQRRRRDDTAMKLSTVIGGYWLVIH